MSKRKDKQAQEFAIDDLPDQAEIDAIESGEVGLSDGAEDPTRGGNPLADATAAGSERVAELETKLADAEGRYMRALADYQNFQRRASINEKEARERGLRDVVDGVLSVLDHFDLALTQDAEASSPEQILKGITVIRDELIRVLEIRGLSSIAPNLNDEFNADLHEAVTQLAGEGVDAGNISMVMQVGYALGERVIRPAKVAIAPGEDG